MSQTLHDFSANDITGNPVNLGSYKGKLVLVVNTASKCGLTPQYKGLEALYREFQDDLVVLGFPCNQFAKQEPGDLAEIRKFCTLSYDVTFPLFEKIEVNGEGAHPVYQFLKAEKPGFFGSEKIKWNFTKFLVGRDGQVIKRFSPAASPDSVKKAIRQILDTE